MKWFLALLIILGTFQINAQLKFQDRLYIEGGFNVSTTFNASSLLTNNGYSVIGYVRKIEDERAVHDYNYNYSISYLISNYYSIKVRWSRLNYSRKIKGNYHELSPLYDSDYFKETVKTKSFGIVNEFSIPFKKHNLIFNLGLEKQKLSYADVILIPVPISFDLYVNNYALYYAIGYQYQASRDTKISIRIFSNNILNGSNENFECDIEEGCFDPVSYGLELSVSTLLFN